jgi:Arc/MetJ-type ribon-helix-helix transcriptional regulator
VADAAPDYLLYLRPGDDRRVRSISMKVTSVWLTDEIHAQLHEEAVRRGMSVSGFVREALEAHLNQRPRQRRLLLAAAAGRSGQHDISERIEDILSR